MKITKTMKYKITYQKELYSVLSDIEYAIMRIKNKATTLAYDWQQFAFSYNTRLGEYPREKDLLGKTLIPDIYGQVKDMGDFIASATVDVATQEAVKKFNQYKLEIAKGSRRMIEYNKDRSFPVRSLQIKGIEKINYKKYKCKLSLLSKEGAKQRNTKSQVPVTLESGSGANVILDRIIEGKYKLCDSRIGKTKNNFYLLVTYQFEKESILDLDENKIMGIDMGVVYPVYMAISDSKQRYSIEGGEIEHFRKGIQSRRNSMLRQGKYCGDGRKGHGRQTMIKPIEKLQNRVEDFKKTTNHKYSKYVIDMAVKHNCGVIQMEDLTGINAKSKFLKNWSYYDLQQKIAYKAKEKGIKVVKVKPNFTSQRCSECGIIHKENRNAKVDQAKFHCINCGFKTNADCNAARNISTKDIEWIIEEQLKFQKELIHS